MLNVMVISVFTWLLKNLPKIAKNLYLKRIFDNRPNFFQGEQKHRFFFRQGTCRRWRRDAAAVTAATAAAGAVAVATSVPPAQP